MSGAYPNRRCSCDQVLDGVFGCTHPAEANDREELYAALDDLDERSRTILQERWLGEQKSTLHELAEQFGVSAERIRQIEKAAMKKLKTQLAA